MLKKPAIAALLALAALNLTGCAAVDEFTAGMGSAAEQAALESDLAELKEELLAIDGVTTVSTDVTVEADYGLSAFASAEVGDIDRKDLASTMTVARDILTRSNVAAAGGRMSVLTPGGDSLYLEGSRAPAEERLLADVDYWWQAQIVLEEPVGMTLDAESGDSENTALVIGGTAVDLADLRKIPHGDAEITAWFSEELSMFGSIAPIEVERAVASADGQLNEMSGEYRLFTWKDEGATISLHFSALVAPDWSQTKKLVETMLAIDPHAATVGTLAISDAAVHFDECTPADVSEKSEKLAKHINAQIPSAKGQAQPGACFAA